MPNSIELIISDLDGTLLDRRSQLSPANEQAIRQAMAQGVAMTIATGKTHYSAKKIISQLGLTIPGVYTQGLVVCTADGTVLHQQQLDMEIIEQAAPIVQEYDIDIFACCHDRMLTPRDSALRHRLHELYDEPLAELSPAVSDWAEAGVCKLLIQGDGKSFPPRLSAQLLELVDGRASLTQSLAHSVEILPLGASKGAGVAWLLQYLGVAPERVMALGDGRNDVEMLQLAGIGVAMDNAMAELKAVADHVVGRHDEDGVAEAIGRFVL